MLLLHVKAFSWQSQTNFHQAQADAGRAGLEKESFISQRRRDDKIKFSVFEGGGVGALGSEEENRPKRFFRGKRHDNKILKVQFLLSRNFVVIAQAQL